MKKIRLFGALVAASLFLAACSNTSSNAENQTASAPEAEQKSSSQTKSQSSNSQTASNEIAVTNELDGVFTGQDGDETVTLTIKDGRGTYETKETDGEIDTEEVVVDGDNKLLLIGDDQDSYELKGSDLSITDEDEVLTLKKQ